jgi:hypothetical protein
MSKPKRIGTHFCRWILKGKEEYPPDSHPVYEYRGYYIVRSSPVNKTEQAYFEIYAHFENGEPSGFDFYLNDERGFRRLRDAAGVIDNYLSERGE